MYIERDVRYDRNMNRYEILLDADDLTALDAINELATNVTVRPAPESGAHVVVTLDAYDDALVAYATRFGLLDELDDDDAPLFDRVL